MKPDRDRGEDKAYWAKTKHWATISKFKMPESKPKDNKLYYNIYGWNETAGDGEFYAVHTEEGQPVLIYQLEVPVYGPMRYIGRHQS